MLIQGDDFWDLIKQFDSEGYLLSASAPGEERFLDPGQPDDEGQLLPGYAYSIILVKDIDGHKLLNIRNPWGHFEWLGEWSDQSKSWTEDIKKQLKPSLEENDGTFWMNFDDFIKNFRCLNVCRV